MMAAEATAKEVKQALGDASLQVQKLKGKNSQLPTRCSAE